MSRLMRRLLGDEHGFTMIAAMAALLVVLSLSAAAFAAANGDIRLAGHNSEQKTAYSAAEAGVADYLYHLNQNPNYWSLCTDVPAPDGEPAAPVNQPWDGTGADPRQWRDLPDSGAQYTIELLPASDADATCDPDDPEGSMLDPENGSFRIRATGRTSATSTVKRSIVATFKVKSFLDYLYFTEVEAQDPIVWTKINSCGGTPEIERTPNCYATRGVLKPDGTRGPDLAAWGAQQCAKYWRPPGRRGNEAFPGQIQLGGNWYDYPGVRCTEIVFGANERIDGPMHTNDSILVCDDPVFGRDENDRIEVSARDGASPSEQPYRASGGCAASPQFLGTWTPGAPELKPPQTNSELKQEATYRFRGAVELVLNSDGTMRVTNDFQTPKTKTMPQPENGVIYAETSGCAEGFDPYWPKVYGWNVATSGCGMVSVRGTYTQNLTIGADDDVVVTGDLRKSGDVLMGLIANNFVRVHHPSRFDAAGTASWSVWAPLGGGPKCVNTDGSPTANVTIEAAILALNHSFTVDRYGCGGGLGRLNVIGAIAQKFRGVVGVGMGSSGFIKNYTYDNRLRFRSPPKFIKPENAAWQVARQVEQSPAR